MAYNAGVQSRLGNLEGDMEAVNRDINDIKINLKHTDDVILSNAQHIGALTDFMDSELKKKKEITKLGMIILSACLSVTGSIISALIVVMVAH